LKILDECGFGRDICFLGANEDVSKPIKKINTSSTADKLAVNIHQIGKVFGFLILR
jgi:hypothetical protein